jgi:hypothetical protein
MTNKEAEAAMNEYTIVYRLGLTKRHKMRHIKVTAASEQDAVSLFKSVYPDRYFYTINSNQIIK